MCHHINTFLRGKFNFKKYAEQLSEKIYKKIHCSRKNCILTPYVNFKTELNENHGK